ncbi:sugar efflux transporter [Actinokineospora sp. NBRC 105648]|uniref:sugar efflux transporter n=1 Tax=Actinokineospora sp. NBRC 105648 TaxID=3032206 RepID=UPI0024A5E15B|nr:sugar efflux transporter [Actinokineospora sp. NBRC 105648]GLZ42786.1 putative sugar efflux transporter [Actinokineospora sp. NBRC 105648]
MTEPITLAARVRRRPLVPLASTSVAVGVATSLAVPFLSLFLTREVGADPVALGGFLLAGPVAGVVLSTLVGRLSDTRAIRRTLLVVGGVAGACGYALYAVVRDYWLLLAVSTTLVAITFALMPQVFAYARQVVQDSGSARAPLVISSLRTLVSVSWVVGPPLAALLVATSGFGGLFGTVALCYALVAVLAVLLPDPATGPARPPVERPGRPPARLLVAVPAFVLVQAAGSLGVTTLPLFVTEELHGTAGDAGLVLGLCAALEIPLMIGLGVLAVRGNQHRLVVGGTAVALGYHAAMSAATSVWQVAAAQVLNAVVIAAVMGVGISYFQSLAPDRPGMATTLFTNTAVAGTMISGPLLGVAVETGYRTAYLMSLAMAALGLVLLLAGLRGTRRDPGVIG